MTTKEIEKFYNKIENMKIEIFNREAEFGRTQNITDYDIALYLKTLQVITIKETKTDSKEAIQLARFLMFNKEIEVSKLEEMLETDFGSKTDKEIEKEILEALKGIKIKINGIGVKMGFTTDNEFFEKSERVKNLLEIVLLIIVYTQFVQETHLDDKEISENAKDFFRNISVEAVNQKEYDKQLRNKKIVNFLKGLGITEEEIKKELSGGLSGLVKYKVEGKLEGEFKKKIGFLHKIINESCLTINERGIGAKGIEEAPAILVAMLVNSILFKDVLANDNKSRKIIEKALDIVAEEKEVLEYIKKPKTDKELVNNLAYLFGQSELRVDINGLHCKEKITLRELELIARALFGIIRDNDKSANVVLDDNNLRLLARAVKQYDIEINHKND